MLLQLFFKVDGMKNKQTFNSTMVDLRGDNRARICHHSGCDLHTLETDDMKINLLVDAFLIASTMCFAVSV